MPSYASSLRLPEQPLLPRRMVRAHRTPAGGALHPTASDTSPRRSRRATAVLRGCDRRRTSRRRFWGHRLPRTPRRPMVSRLHSRGSQAGGWCSSRSSADSLSAASSSFDSASADAVPRRSVRPAWCPRASSRRGSIPPPPGAAAAERGRPRQRVRDGCSPVRRTRPGDRRYKPWSRRHVADNRNRSAASSLRS